MLAALPWRRRQRLLSLGFLLTTALVSHRYKEPVLFSQAVAGPAPRQGHLRRQRQQQPICCPCLRWSLQHCSHSGKAARHALPDIGAELAQLPEKVEAMGPAGPFYFFVVYALAECVAIPATPLTLTAGYLFGPALGVAVVLGAGTTAAAIGFLLSRSILRPQVQSLAENNEQFVKIDRAVRKQGFKIILLLRLSPLLPFSLSNYFYGLTDVEFGPYLAATALGFLPGTCAYVLGASSLRSLSGGAGPTDNPAFLAGAALLTAALLKLAGDTAAAALEETDDE